MHWRPTTAPSKSWATRPCATIARELVETVRNNVTIDWTLRENVRANLRRLVKRTAETLRLSAGQAGAGDADRP